MASIWVDPSTPKLCVANKVNIRVSDPQDHFSPAIIHEPPIKYEVQSFIQTDKRTSAVVLVSGAGGGVSGPGGIYPSLADKIALLLSIPCIRLDYRTPAETNTCTTTSAPQWTIYKRNTAPRNLLVVGWSFGGSPCFTIAAEEPSRVRGIVAIASQTAGTAGVKSLAPRPMLLLHGEDDLVLSPSCSETLFRQYGGRGDRRMRLFPGDDHGLTKNAALVERKIFAFAAWSLGLDGIVDTDVLELAGMDLVHGRDERVREMERGCPSDI